MVGVRECIGIGRWVGLRGRRARTCKPKIPKTKPESLDFVGRVWAFKLGFTDLGF